MRQTRETLPKSNRKMAWAKEHALWSTSEKAVSRGTTPESACAGIAN